MAFGCPICSEKLDKLPADPQANRGGSGQEVNISATPCGHIFHSYCIQKWLSGSLASSKKCPCCRKDVPKLRCLALFPNNFDESVLDDSIAEGPGGFAPCNHGEVISSLGAKVNRLESLNRDLEQMNKLLSEDFNTLEQRFSREKIQSDTWMMKAKQYESYRDLSNEMEARALKAENRLKTYTQMENMLKGIESSIDEELSGFPPTTDSIKTLLECKQVLTRELKNAAKRAEDTKRKYEDIRGEQMKLRVQYDHKCRELKELKHVFEISRVNGRVRDNSPVAGPSSAMDGATPKVFRMKRRLQEPTEIKATSILKADDPNVDSDIEIFQPMTHKKVKSSKSSQKPASQLKTKKDVQVTSKKVQKFPSCGISPIVMDTNSEKTSSNGTIDIASDSDKSDDDDLKIRGNVPGAGLPIASKRIKTLQQKSSRPILGKSSPPTIPIKKFSFKKRLN